MTARSRANLITEFQTGDVPDGDDYKDLIDSALNLTDSSAQTVTSKLTISGGVETTNVTAQRVFASAATFTGAVSASTLNGTTLQGSTIRLTQTVSASSMWVDGPAKFDGTVSASSAWFNGGVRLINAGIGTAAPSEGLHIVVSGDSNFRIDVPTTVVASAGVSGPATPASVAGFIPVIINGVRKKIAFYEP
jgi:hypothetical protein